MVATSVPVLISQQFSQNEQLNSRRGPKLKAQCVAPVGLVSHPCHLNRQYQRLPEGGRAQCELSWVALREGLGTTNLCPAQSEIYHQTRNEFPGLWARNLGRQVHAMTLFSAKVVETGHTARLPHVRRHRGALEW